MGLPEIPIAMASNTETDADPASGFLQRFQQPLQTPAASPAAVQTPPPVTVDQQLEAAKKADAEAAEAFKAAKAAERDAHLQVEILRYRKEEATLKAQLDLTVTHLENENSNLKTLTSSNEVLNTRLTAAMSELEGHIANLNAAKSKEEATQAALAAQTAQLEAHKKTYLDETIEGAIAKDQLESYAGQLQGEASSKETNENALVKINAELAAEEQKLKDAGAAAAAQEESAANTKKSLENQRDAESSELEAELSKEKTAAVNMEKELAGLQAQIAAKNLETEQKKRTLDGLMATQNLLSQKIATETETQTAQNEMAQLTKLTMEQTGPELAALKPVSEQLQAELAVEQNAEKAIDEKLAAQSAKSQELAGKQQAAKDAKVEEETLETQVAQARTQLEALRVQLATANTEAASRCWMIMPSGCNTTLSETTTPKEWFVDPHSGTAAKCQQSIAGFNQLCNATDAMKHWGIQPPQAWGKVTKHCIHNYAVNTIYTSLAAAQAACADSTRCTGVYDDGCDSGDFRLCNGVAHKASSMSCIYVKAD